MLLSHRARLLRALAYRRNLSHRYSSFSIEDAPQLQPLARLIRLHPAAWGKKHQPNAIKYALEDMGTLFLKLGQLLSTRRDLVPPEIIEQLVQLQDKVKPFNSDVAITQIQDPKHGLWNRLAPCSHALMSNLLAAASIAQVHTAALHDGRGVVGKSGAS